MEINELMSDRSERSKNDPKQDVVGLCFRLYSVVHLNVEPYLLGILGPSWPTSMPIALGQGEGPGAFLFDADLSGAGDLGLDDWLDIWNPTGNQSFYFC
jgi:hypothetical protein